MRWNLDINFGQIEDISSSASEYASSVKELKSALNSFLAVVKTNEGQAVQALQEKPQELTDALDKNAEGLQLVSKLLKEFDSAMTGIIAPVSEGSNLQINTLQVKNKLKELDAKLDLLVSTSRTITIPKLPPLPPEEKSDDSTKPAKPSVDRSLYYSVKAQLERMEDVLDGVKSGSSALSSTYTQQIENIRKKVEDFEDTDDQFENKAESAWEDYQDLKWCQTTTGKIVLGTVGVAACIGIAVIGIPAIAIGLATMGVSAGASVAIATGAVVLAKGAAVGAIATTAIDTGMAIYNKQDVDSAAGKGLINGMVTGAVSAGVGAALPSVISKGAVVAKKGISMAASASPGMAAKVTQAGAKVASTAGKVAPGMTAKVTQFGQKVVNNSANITKSVSKMAGDVAEDAAEAALDEDKKFDLKKSTFKAASGEAIGLKKKDIVKKIDKKIDKLEVDTTLKKGAKIVNKSAGGVVGDEAKSIVNDAYASVEKSNQGEGNAIENFEHKTTLTNPEKVVKSVRKANKIDDEALADKALDFIEKSMKKKARNAH